MTLKEYLILFEELLHPLSVLEELTSNEPKAVEFDEIAFVDAYIKAVDEHKVGFVEQQLKEISVVEMTPYERN